MKLAPKKLFSENAAANQDIDAQVIRKQEKTFEEMLESQLKQDTKPAKMPAGQEEDMDGKCLEAAEEGHTTPIKEDQTPRHTNKKAFLRRGSNSKYDPQQARKQSQGSTKKFKYYTDNFSNQKKQIAPKGTTGIPQLSANRQSKEEEKKAADAANQASSPRKHAGSNRRLEKKSKN